MMAARKIGAAAVVNPEHSGVGILTERDILNSVAAGESPDTETAAMVRGGFRHLVMRDIVRVWPAVHVLAQARVARKMP